MQRRFALAGLLVVVLSSMAAQAAAQGLPRDFTSAYRPALEAIKKTYTHATVEGTFQQSFPQAGKSIERKFILRSIGSWFRLDATTMGQQGTGEPIGGTKVFLATPGASLQTFQHPSSRMFDEDSLKQDNYDEAKTRIRDACPINLAYSFDNRITILEMLQQGDVKITGFKKGKRDGEPMIQINYEQEIAPDGRHGPWKCSMLISIDENYALREFSRTTGHGNESVTIRGSLSYTVDRNGIPLVQRIERRQEQGARRTVHQRETIDISRFDTEPPHTSWFGADSM